MHFIKRHGLGTMKDFHFVTDPNVKIVAKVRAT